VKLGQRFNFPEVPTPDPAWLAITWSESIEEVEYLGIHYLGRQLQALQGQPQTLDVLGLHLMDAHITPRGYELLEKLRGGNAESSIGFCAMWFDEDIKPLWLEAIEPAIRMAGYEPKRIDQHEHVNRIDDEIVAMIRRSRFVVADFTGQRGGVYFEAGYALGPWFAGDLAMPRGPAEGSAFRYAPIQLPAVEGGRVCRLGEAAAKPNCGDSRARTGETLMTAPDVDEFFSREAAPGWGELREAIGSSG
jgi:hypothetical protein